MPATSSKVTRPCFSVSSRAFDLPKPMARPVPLCIWRMKKMQTPTSTRTGSQLTKMQPRLTPSSAGPASTRSTFLISIGISCSSTGVLGT